MSRILKVMIITLFIFCFAISCREKEIKNIPSDTEENSVNLATDNFLYGKTLEELGYQFIIPDNANNTISPYYASQGVNDVSYLFSEQKPFPRAPHLIEMNGSGGMLTAPIYEEKPALDIGSITLLFTQTFDKKEIKNDSIINIDKKEYSISDFENRVLMENDNIIMYNITDLITRMNDFDSYTSETYDSELRDIIWAKEVRQYYIENMEKAIVSID